VKRKKPKAPLIHTSDSRSAPASDEYRKNWDKIFGGKR